MERYSGRLKGEFHIKKGLPCQDYIQYKEISEGWIALVADGHGSPRHYR